MTPIEPLLAPGGLIREIALSWSKPNGMPCCGLTEILAMAQAGRIPQDALDGRVDLDCWAREAGARLHAEFMVNTGDPWSNLRAVQSLLGGELVIQATASAPCPVLTPGRTHYIQRWLYGLEEGGHSYCVKHAPEGERPYYGGTPLRVVQSWWEDGYTDRGETDWTRRAGSVFGVLTLPAGV